MRAALFFDLHALRAQRESSKCLSKFVNFLSLLGSQVVSWLIMHSLLLFVLFWHVIVGGRWSLVTLLSCGQLRPVTDWLARLSLVSDRCHGCTVAAGSAKNLITDHYSRGLLSLPAADRHFWLDLCGNRCVGNTIIAGSSARSRLELGQL